MKKFLLLIIVTALFSACNEQEKRYTQDSSEIDSMKALISDYNAMNYESLVTYYADTSQTRFNNAKMKSTDIPAYHKANDANYSSRGFEDKDQDFEMVVTDKGQTWVNFWATWKGTLAANNKEITIPVHLTAQFINGKIVEDYGYWDPSEVILSLQEIEAEKMNMEAETTQE
ncbi:nuclear transport factor 2 family protein [Changchengzhania lutea]|uniref:nuclear transport factor 2 family protein n=1 Tax=Changchengzhania lutea TaxID=2049305 RepID=UPI00115E91F7|nr:nuclear transport factor 2 family protein [Changchengzhania lutea]